MANEVRRNDTETRYELHADGVLAGFASYRVVDDRLVFTHTEIDDAFEGQGLGSELVLGALDDVRARGERIVAQCPFVRRFLERHQDHRDLVDTDLEQRLQR